MLSCVKSLVIGLRLIFVVCFGRGGGSEISFRVGMIGVDLVGVTP